MAVRRYGKPSKRSKAERLFAELPQSPLRLYKEQTEDAVADVAGKLATIHIDDDSPKKPLRSPRKSKPVRRPEVEASLEAEDTRKTKQEEQRKPDIADGDASSSSEEFPEPESGSKYVDSGAYTESTLAEPDLRVLQWDDVCSSGDRIEKIAEASYAEIYRVTNDRGTSIIKVIRLQSPIKAFTKAQVRARLVDEKPHSEDGVRGELQISEWLADIPGFVVYKERYFVQGKATKQLLETHQAFQRRMKRKDPGRAQFYPSPSRYLDETKFLVVELGDAGVALEDWKLTSQSQLWDIFFLEAIALARAEDHAMFEHRDLHEGNLCVRQVSPPRKRDAEKDGFFGHSGLDITILDYGLSRAEDLDIDFATPVSVDLEKDLSLFTSTHATHCQVYRQMRSFLLTGERECLPPGEHDQPYETGVNGPLDWAAYAPYTNVLWLAYLYEYLLKSFVGEQRDLARFKGDTKEMWVYLNPKAGNEVPCFGSAADVVCFAVDAGWIREGQLVGTGSSILSRDDSILPASRYEGRE